MDIESIFEFLKKHLIVFIISITITFPSIFFSLSHFNHIKHIDHLMYTIYQDDNYSLNIGEDHLQFMLSTMEYCEELSYERLMDLWDLLEGLRQEDQAILYKITNENQSIIRMLMELDNIYCKLAESDKGIKKAKDILEKRNLEEILKTFYNAYDLILRYKTEDLEKEKQQVLLKRAYMLFKKIYKNADKFPEDIPDLREDIKIETLNFLTFCVYCLENKYKPSSREQEKWNSYAQEIRDGKKDLTGSEYRRKYYWVDLNAFFTNLAVDGDPKKEKKDEKAWNAFNAMVRDIYDIKFLKSKFKQHQSRVEEKLGEKLNGYIELLENSAP